MFQEIGQELPKFSDIYGVSGLFFSKKNPEYRFELDELRDSILEKLPAEKEAMLADAFGGWTKRVLDVKFRRVQALTAVCVLTSAGISSGTSFIPIAKYVSSLVMNCTIDLVLLHIFKERVARIYGFNEGTRGLKTQAMVIIGGEIAAKIVARILFYEHESSERIIPKTIGLISIFGAIVSGVISGATMAACCCDINNIYYEAAMKIAHQMRENENPRNEGK